MIYLDNAASTPVKPEVVRTLQNVIQYYGNPSSVHTNGIEARKILLQASEHISTKLNCKPDELYYTNGATMSNCIFIQGFLRAHKDAALIISAIEHNDIMEMAEYIEKNTQHPVVIIPVNHDGIINLDELNNAISKFSEDKIPILCSIQLANGECGVIQPHYEISRIIHTYDNAYWHTDATQYLPYYPIDIHNMGIDALSMSGQKIGCIKGVGLLFVRKSIKVDPIIFGEQGLIGGTENVPGIACLDTAFSILSYSQYANKEKQKYLIDNLKDVGTLVGSETERLPNNAYFIFEQYDGESFVVLLDTMGISASAGSACSMKSENGSHVVKAMGYKDWESKHCVRFSLDNNITYEDLNYVITIVKELLYDA